MNTTHIIGNLTGNPKSRMVNTAKGPNTVCEFTVAVHRMTRGKETADFFRVTTWNNLADACMKCLVKGRQVEVTGPVTASAYLGNDGTPRASLEIQDVKEIEFLGSGPRTAEEEWDERFVTAVRLIPEVRDLSDRLAVEVIGAKRQ